MRESSGEVLQFEGKLGCRVMIGGVQVLNVVGLVRTKKVKAADERELPLNFVCCWN